MRASAPRNHGKRRFVKEVLNDNPHANAAAVNEAWRAAGMAGRISAALVNHLRFRMRLSGSLRARRTTGTKRARWTVQARAGTNRKFWVCAEPRSGRARRDSWGWTWAWAPGSGHR
jgi:hypothetical protein